jgi:hypothetical protein
MSAQEQALVLMESIASELALGTKHYDPARAIIYCLLEHGRVDLVPTPERKYLRAALRKGRGQARKAFCLM